MRIRNFIYHRIVVAFLLTIYYTPFSAQYLSKSYYLIDSLEKSKILPSDFVVITNQLKVYHQSNNDTVKLEALHNLIENVNDDAVWPKYNWLLYSLAKEKQKKLNTNEIRPYRLFEAIAYNNIGYYLYNHTELVDSAIYYYKKGVAINEEYNNYLELITGYSNVANAYQNSGKVLEALELLNKCLSLEDKVSDKTKFLAPYNNLANIQLFLNDTTSALINLKKALYISNRSDDKSMKAHLLHNIGTLNRNKNYNEALQSVKKAYYLRKEIGDLRGVAQSLISLAGFAIRVHNIGLAKQYIKDVEPILPQLNNQYVYALFYRVSADALHTEGEIDKAFVLYEKSMQTFQKIDAKIDLAETLSNVINSYRNNKKYKDKVYDMYILLSDIGKLINKTNIQKSSLQSQYQNQLKAREAEIKTEQTLKDEKNKLEKRRQQYISFAISLILVITLIFSFFIYRAMKANKEKNVIISQQKLEVEKQKHFIEEKQKEIIDSINYSKRIQNSFLPTPSEFNNAFPSSFIVYQPKDIVSGDFYWLMDSNNYPTITKKMKGIAVADCTGHGVPGSLLSMLGASILNQAILEPSVQSPSDVLNFLNAELKKNIRSTSDEIIRDGMDISCCIIFPETLMMHYAGANNPCWIIRDKKIIELKATKQAVTAYKEDVIFPFVTTEIQLLKNDLVVLFTDGYADQFGGPKGKKFKYKQLENLLIESSSLPHQEQQKTILNTFNVWKGDLDQVDDVCLVGVRI